MRHLHLKTTRPGLALFAALSAGLAQAAEIQTCNHVTDGVFNGSASSTDNATEWGCPTVSQSAFAQVGNAGGAVLYADQGGQPGANGFLSTLYLMYDYVAGAAPASFFDVFFEVVPDGHAYLVRIPAPTSPDPAPALLAFERPIGSVAPLDQNGSFDIGPNSGWEALSDADKALADFRGAVGFGSSPNNPVAHPMAEFQLSINQATDPSQPSGLYDPSPAFWSASVKAVDDPPLSSGVFTLHPDGTTTVTPALGPDGGPVMQGSVLPEPATLLLFLPGLLALARFRRPS